MAQALAEGRTVCSVAVAQSRSIGCPLPCKPTQTGGAGISC